MGMNTRTLKWLGYGAIVGYLVVTGFFLATYLMAATAGFNDVWFWVGSLICVVCVMAGAMLSAYIFHHIKLLEDGEPK